MKELIQHIENLLPDHDCVVVPGLGGFVQNEISARFDPIADMFYPEGKEICFNSRLTFNDGYLVQAYQESFGIGFEEANLKIRLGVQEIMNKVDEGRYVSLGRIGVMWKNEQGQLVFRTENKNFFIPDAYGLTAFSFPTLDKRHRKTAHTEHHTRRRKDEEFINIRLPRNSFRNFLVGAAACLFMLLLSKPAGNLPGTNSQEAFLLHNYLSAPDKDEPTKDEPKEEQYIDETLPVLNEPIPEVERKEEVVEEAKPTPVKINRTEKAAKTKEIKEKPAETETSEKELKVEENVANQEPYAPEKPKTAKKAKKVAGHTYYVIISSFPEKGMAQEWLKRQGRGGIFRFAGIIEKEGRARIYARRFSDKSTAENFLNQFRLNNPEYASAWLLGEKKQ